jgi:V/A-type H+/Na+-transporting ATPase subunit C
VKNNKVSYEFNPYTYARICAMKSLLIKKEDYDRLLKMDPNEIIKFMQDGIYKEEINSYAIKYSGVKLVEHSLNKHLTKIFMKLNIISDPKTRELMNQYLKRYDFWNIKTILRGRQAGISQEEILNMLLPVGFLKPNSLKRLASKNTAAEIIAGSFLVSMPEFRTAISAYEQTKDLSEIENMLDYHYYLDSAAFAEKIVSQGKLFKEFFMYEFDIYNMKLLFKKIFFKLDKSHVDKFMLPRGKHLTSRQLKKMLTIDNMASLLIEIKKTPYGKIFSHVKTEDVDPLLRFEIILDEFLLKKSILLLHQHPLSIDIVLGFMFAKEIEVKNLRTIIKSKSLELTEDYVKRLIVI